MFTLFFVTHNHNQNEITGGAKKEEIKKERNVRWCVIESLKCNRCVVMDSTILRVVVFHWSHIEWTMDALTLNIVFNMSLII